MIIYIWLLLYNVVVYCAPDAGCIQSSMAHFNYLMSVGALEMIFELRGVIKIYVKKKFDSDKGPQKFRMRKDK